MKFKIAGLLLVVSFACSQQAEKPTAQGGWITGTEQEKVETITKNFIGQDKTKIGNMPTIN